MNHSGLICAHNANVFYCFKLLKNVFHAQITDFAQTLGFYFVRINQKMIEFERWACSLLLVKPYHGYTPCKIDITNILNKIINSRYIPDLLIYNSTVYFIYEVHDNILEFSF